MTSDLEAGFFQGVYTDKKQYCGVRFHVEL